jgi:hypothetical protein
MDWIDLAHDMEGTGGGHFGFHKMREFLDWLMTG